MMSPITVLLKSMDSFKVLTECPLIVMLLFQLYPRFIQRNIPPMLPLMMNVLGININANLAQIYKLRFKELIASQVRIIIHNALLIS
jgi:transformation/transcription domain-associated protein